MSVEDSRALLSRFANRSVGRYVASQFRLHPLQKSVKFISQATQLDCGVGRLRTDDLVGDFGEVSNNTENIQLIMEGPRFRELPP